MPAFQDPDIYRNILDTLQIGVSVLDLEKEIVFWSDGAEQITWLFADGCAGPPLHGKYSSSLRPNYMCNEKCPLATALHDAKPGEAMTLIHHKSGHRMQVHVRAIPLRDKHGSIIGIIQTFEGEFDVHGTHTAA